MLKLILYYEIYKINSYYFISDFLEFNRVMKIWHIFNGDNVYLSDNQFTRFWFMFFNSRDRDVYNKQKYHLFWEFNLISKRRDQILLKNNLDFKEDFW